MLLGSTTLLLCLRALCGLIPTNIEPLHGMDTSISAVVSPSTFDLCYGSPLRYRLAPRSLHLPLPLVSPAFPPSHFHSLPPSLPPSPPSSQFISPDSVSSSFRIFPYETLYSGKPTPNSLKAFEKEVEWLSVRGVCLLLEGSIVKCLDKTPKTSKNRASFVAKNTLSVSAATGMGYAKVGRCSVQLRVWNGISLIGNPYRIVEQTPRTQEHT